MVNMVNMVNNLTDHSDLLPLGNSQLFNGVADEDIEAMIQCLGATFQDYKKNEIIHMAGDFIGEIGIVLNGRIRTVKEDFWGNSNIIEEITEGEMFSEVIIGGGIGVLPFTVMSVVDTRVLFADFQRIISVCSSACVFHTLLIRNMIGVIARKNIMLLGKMEHITRRTTREKLLSYLSEQSKLQKSRNFEIPFNRQELSDYLSVERSALSAEMSKLKAEGIINYRKNYFEML